MPKKILVVDDDELTVRLLSTRLQEKGFTVISAITGEDSIAKAIKESPDAVIMDIMLPDMQGSDAVRVMQDNPDISDDMKIIFLSGIISKKDANEGKIQIGGKFYPAVSKPIDFDLLLQLIR